MNPYLKSIEINILVDNADGKFDNASIANDDLLVTEMLDEQKIS